MTPVPPPLPLNEEDRNRLRDEFAAAAVQGGVAHHGLPTDASREDFVKSVWALATALIQARQKP